MNYIKKKKELLISLCKYTIIRIVITRIIKSKDQNLIFENQKKCLFWCQKDGNGEKASNELCEAPHITEIM